MELKMAPYIFTERNGIYIIDLQKTVKKLEDAYMAVRDIAADGKEILFVGTEKSRLRILSARRLKRCGMPYVNARWLGGMLTNFNTIQRRIKRLEQLKTWRLTELSICFPRRKLSSSSSR